MGQHDRAGRVRTSHFRSRQGPCRRGLRRLCIYLPQASEQTPVLYRRAGDGLSQPDFERMRNNGVPFLCVRSGDLSKCETILEAKLIDLLGSSDIRPTEKAKIVHQVGTSVARGLIHGPANADGLARASHVVDNVIGCVLNDPRIASHMLQMADHERSTASHMFVVSASPSCLELRSSARNARC